MTSSDYMEFLVWLKAVLLTDNNKITEYDSSTKTFTIVSKISWQDGGGGTLKEKKKVIIVMWEKYKKNGKLQNIYKGIE